VQLNFEFLSGVVGSASISTDSPGGCGHRIEFSGESGGLYLHNPTKDYMNGFTVYIKSRDGIERYAPDNDKDNWPEYDDSRIKAVAQLFNRFGDWIEDSVPQRPNFEDGLRAQRLLHDAKRSHEAGGIWINL
jgi:predicted dehydrogenase